MSLWLLLKQNSAINLRRGVVSAGTSTHACPGRVPPCVSCPLKPHWPGSCTVSVLRARYGTAESCRSTPSSLFTQSCTVLSWSCLRPQLEELVTQCNLNANENCWNEQHKALGQCRKKGAVLCTYVNADEAVAPPAPQGI